MFLSTHWKKNNVLNTAKKTTPLWVSSIDSVRKLIVISIRNNEYR